MKTLAIVIFITFPCRADPPECKTDSSGTATIRSCKRSQIDSCLSYVQGHIKELDTVWLGCSWPALITTAFPDVPSFPAYLTHISVFASYRDSETMEITATYLKAYCGKKVWTWKKVQIVTDSDHPSNHKAVAEMLCVDAPPDVPIVDATENGGQKSMLHVYR